MNSKKFKIAHNILMLIATIIGAGIFTYLIYNFFDFNSMNFIGSKSTKLFFSLLLLFIAVLIIVPSLLLSNEDNKKMCPKFIFYIIAVLSIASGLLGMIKMFDIYNVKSISSLYKWLSIGAVITAIVNGIYYIFLAISKAKSALLLSISLPIWATLDLASLYFNPTYTHICYTKLVQNIVLILFILSALNEVKYLTSKVNKTYKNIISLLSASFGIIYSIPTVIIFTINGKFTEFSITTQFALLAYSIYCIVAVFYKNQTHELIFEEIQKEEDESKSLEEQDNGENNSDTIVVEENPNE